MATELTPYQRDILIRTALGEARGEGVEGMADVIQVILNRANSGDFPADPAAAALQPNEFSAWNPVGRGGNNPSQFSTDSDTYKRGERALDLVLSGTRPDYTGGALFYKTPSVKSPFHDSQNKFGTIERNGHLYYPTRPVPPGEIPNVVASLQDTTPPPRVAPNPATISPDLSLMRNPNMSSSARMAQITPPLPQPRPVSPMDIARAPGTTVATIPTMPGQSQIERITPMPSAREIAMAPGQTIATIPTSGIGQPPATRTVQSVPYTLQPTAREIAEAPGTTIATIPTSPQRLPSLPRTIPGQSSIERNPPVLNATQATAQTAPRAMNMGSRDSVANAALGQRVATQMAPAFNQPSFIPDRLVPNPIVQPSFVPLNQPPIQVVPSPLSSAVPLPRRRPLTPIAPVQRVAPQPMPRMAQAASPLRAVVNGANSYRAPIAQQPMTRLQQLVSNGMTQAQAYNALAAYSRPLPSVEDRVTGRTGLSSYSGSAQSLSS